MSVFDEIAVELVASDLATEVVYRSSSGDPRTVSAIVVRTSDDERRATSVYGRLFVSLADFAQPPARGDEVSIGAEAYRVFEVAHESGGAWLWIRKD